MFFVLYTNCSYFALVVFKYCFKNYHLNDMHVLNYNLINATYLPKSKQHSKYD